MSATAAERGTVTPAPVPGWRHRVESGDRPGYPIERRHAGDGFVVEIRHGGAPLADPAWHSLLCALPWRSGQRPPGQYGSDPMALVPSERAYAITQSARRDRQLCLRFSPELLEAVLPPGQPRHTLTLRSDLQSVSLRNLLHRIAVELEAPGLASDILMQSFCVAAMIELNRSLVAEPPVTGAAERVVRIVQSRLCSRLDRPESLQSLAAGCGIGVRHLSRIFRATTGMSIGHYAAKMRIDQAKRLLSDPSVMIKEVSWRCGFREQAAFTTAFRKATGQSPTAYRGK